ncbi:MAG: hypothetical protein HKN22_05070, partial [Bacteroidia bacterium]|nr:hypothetical protein [Bacteroidia bacterium]
MCSAAFYYPADKIFQASRDALMRKGYRILEEDLKNGYLKARSRFSIFRKSYSVELNIVTQDSISTLNLRSGDNLL